jgi:hypothetical protein
VGLFLFTQNLTQLQNLLQWVQCLLFLLSVLAAAFFALAPFWIVCYIFIQNKTDVSRCVIFFIPSAKISLIAFVQWLNLDIFCGCRINFFTKSVILGLAVVSNKL